MEDSQIQYKGKWIQDFYIEGLDMLEGRYEIAINNINAKMLPRLISWNTINGSKHFKVKNSAIKQPLI